MRISTHLFERRPTPVAQVDDDRSYRLMIPSIVACLIATTVLPLRFYCRRSIKQSLWWDDYLIIIAYFLAFTCLSFMIYWTSLGLGKHVAVVQMESPNTVTTIFHTLVPAEFSYATSILFTKYSILAFYWRIFSVRSMMIAVRIMLAITTLWLIGGGTAALLSCVPLQKLWNPAVPGTCIKTRTLYIGAAIPNVITDFVILIMPLPYVWHLKISRQKRIGLSLTFIFGGLICVISFIRLVFVFKLDMEEDLTWNFIDTLIWTAVETFGGIICACLPMLRPLFIKPSNRPTSSASSSKDSRFSGPRSPFRAEHADGPTRTGTFGTVGKTQGQGSWTPKTTAYEMEGDIPLDGPRDVVMNVGMELKERER